MTQSLGIALHLYEDNNAPIEASSDNVPFNVTPKEKQENQGKPNGKISDKQISFITSLANDKEIELPDFCQNHFGKDVDFLSKQEASKLIQNLMTA